jgi:hypothetical protein
MVLQEHDCLLVLVDYHFDNSFYLFPELPYSEIPHSWQFHNLHLERQGPKQQGSLPSHTRRSHQQQIRIDNTRQCFLG